MLYRRQVTHSRSHSQRVAKLEPNLIWFWSQLCLYGQWLKHILLQQAEPPSGGPIVQLGGKGQLCPGASPLSKWLKRWAVFLGTFRKPGPAGQSGREDWARGRRAPLPTRVLSPRITPWHLEWVTRYLAHGFHFGVPGGARPCHPLPFFSGKPRCPGMMSWELMFS